MNEKPLVLVVDDSRTNLGILVNLLEDYEVAVAVDGLNAIELLKVERPDIILLDIVMPGISGLEVCKKIREQSELKDIPILFITARNDEESIVKAFEVGGSDYVTKPFNPKELLARVKHHISYRRTVIELRAQIEETRRAELRLQQAQKMEAIGMMAGGVAHDLNNILIGLVTFPELLLIDLEPDDEMVEPLMAIRKAGRRASDIVSDLLTVARGVASPREIVDFVSLMDEYQRSPEHQEQKARFSQVSLSVVEDDKGPFKVNASAVHLRKVVMNLLLNAYEAIEGVGEIRLTLSRKTLDFPVPGYQEVKVGEYVKLSVQDDGEGIPRETIKHIFEPFYSRKVLGKSGTGLGLTIVWNTVHDHEGYIQVLSGEYGTVFELYFPAAKGKCPTSSKILPFTNLLGQGEEILIVDDEQVQRDVAGRALVRLGYRVTLAESGEAALRILEQKPRFSLVLLDMIMSPGLNGRETYERALKINPGLKALIVSGYVETKEVRKTVLLGASGFIKKPYTINELAAFVKDAISSQKPLSVDKE